MKNLIIVHGSKEVLILNGLVLYNFLGLVLKDLWSVGTTLKDLLISKKASRGKIEY